MFAVSGEVTVIIMLIGLVIGVFLGFPIAFTLGGLGVLCGYFFWGTQVITLLASKIYAVFSNYSYVAIPLFIFMGSMLDASGVADTAFGVLNQWLRKIKGGLGIATIILCTLFAACTGVVGASVTAMGVLALPPMLKHGYDHGLATGIVAAGGTLGILIPPSIMLVLFGPMANISVVDLFSSAIPPGLLLSALYILWVIIFVHIKKDAIKQVEVEDDDAVHYTVLDGVKAFVPFIFLIFLVLGMILLGVCSPTEASAIGSLGSVILAAAYKKLNWKVIKNAATGALSTSAMVMALAAGANVFTSVFFGVGGNRVMTEFVLGLGLGKAGTMIAVMILVFILGMLIDWVGILLIVIPIFMPILQTLGFDTLWASMMIIVLLQTSFLTPPFAYALFYVKGVAPEGVTTGEIYKGVIPFITIIWMVLGFMAINPGFINLLSGLFGTH